MTMNSLKNRNLEGEKVILRTDLNMPIEDGEPQKAIRFEQYKETIQKLSQNQAEILVIAHQGRPGRKDFTSLEKHAKILSNELEQDVELLKGFFTDRIEVIEDMEKGEVKMLENVRFLSEELKNYNPEKHSNDHYVKNIAPHFDIYINDAFSAAHRSHASLVGFNKLLEDYSGPVMGREIQNCQKVIEQLVEGVLVLGGEKPADIVSMMEEKVDDVNKVLLGGIPGEADHLIKGNNIGQKEKWLKNQNINLKEDKLKKLLREYPEKIIPPEDFRTDISNHAPKNMPENQMTWDMGEKTIEKYTEIIKEADNVLLKGPMGAFDQGYEKGTEAIIDAIAQADAYTVMGGGHTSSLVKRFNHDLEDFNHVSIAGGAFVRFLSGEELAAIEALKE